MIARIKVLGMRAAIVGALRVAARDVVSYLPGGDNNTPSAGEKGSQGAGGTVAASPEWGGPRGAVGYYVAGGCGRSQGRARGEGAAALGLAGPVSAGELEEERTIMWISRTVLGSRLHARPVDDYPAGPCGSQMPVIEGPFGTRMPSGRSPQDRRSPSTLVDTGSHTRHSPRPAEG